MLPAFDDLGVFLAVTAGPDVFALPPQMQSLLAVGMWVLIGAGAIGTLAACVSIWANLRRKPGLDETFATKTELLAAENRMGTRLDNALHGIDQQQKTIMEQLRALFSKSDASTKSLMTHATEVERAIGRIEGEMKALSAGKKG